MHKRTLKELNLLDDFLFGSMFSFPGINEEFIRELLKIIVGKTFGSLTVIPQKYYYGADTEFYGARLDVYLEDDLISDSEHATIYDVEPEQKSDNTSIASLPRRVRFYHARIDACSLESGKDYHTLKNVIVIMIMPFDPFGENRMIYTIRNRCTELPDMEYDDGAATLFLYTKGTVGDPPEALRQLLRYMENSTEENAVNADLQHIHQLVNKLKNNTEVSFRFMKIFEREQMLIRQAKAEEAVNTEFERKRADTEKARADAEKARADAEKARADTEKARADAVKQELQQLKQQISRQNHSTYIS